VLWKFPSIEIAPTVIIPLFPDGNGITNTLLGTWIVIAILLAFFFFATRRRDLIPSGLQNFAEWAVESLQGLVESVAGKEKGRLFFPLVATFFIFIFICNMIDILPVVDTIGTITKGATVVHGPFLFGNDTDRIAPWFRPPTSDINLTLSMAIVSVVTTQFFGFSILGAWRQLGRYFQFQAFKKGPLGTIDFFVGLIELVAEVMRLISFSFRLFGNIFAGSVLLAIFAYLIPFLANIIFIPLEIFVGFMQAFVFAVLTLAFMELGTTTHDHEEGETVHEAEEEFARSHAAGAH